jgi:hypothetical protein
MIEANSLISRQDVSVYFSDDYEGCKELSDEFVSRILDNGCDSSISSRLNHALKVWANADPGYDALEASRLVHDLVRSK